MKLHSLYGLAFGLAVLSACTAPQDAMQARDASDARTAASSTEAQLGDYHWRLDRVVDATGGTDGYWLRPAGTEPPLTLDFRNGMLAVSGLCNTMSGAYQLDGSQLRVGPLASTRRLCADDALMQYERAVEQRLPQVTSMHFTEITGQPAQPRLTLHFPDNGQWVLTGTATPETLYGNAGETLFLEIAPQTVPCADPTMSQRQCLYVRRVNYDANGLKQGYGAWEPFYDPIEGYRHQPGVRNILRVKRHTRPQAPADASGFAYILDMVVESESGPAVPLAQ